MFVALAALVGASCAAPTTAPAKTWEEFCAPADWPQASFVATPLVVPAGAWLHAQTRWELDGDSGEFDIHHDVELVAGESVPLLGADAGKCIHVTWSGGLHFTVGAVPSILNGSTTGFPPGWDGGPL